MNLFILQRFYLMRVFAPSPNGVAFLRVILLTFRKPAVITYDNPEMFPVHFNPSEHTREK